MKEKLKGAILIISCHKHKETRLKKYILEKTDYRGYKVFYVIGNPNIKSMYEIVNGNCITLRCEDSYLHILKKVIMSIDVITTIYDIEEGILRCGDDLIFNEPNLCHFLESPKLNDYMGNMDGYGSGNKLIPFENISKRTDMFMVNYFKNHPEDILNPLNGIGVYTNIMDNLNIVPNCRYVDGVVVWLSIKSCSALIKELSIPAWDTCMYNDNYGFPYIIEDIGIGFILAKNNIYPVGRTFYINNGIITPGETIAVHTNEFK